MPELNRTNPAMNLPNRERRTALMRQLRAEQEGRSVPGFAEYMQQMEQLDTMMEQLSLRDAWGVTIPLDAKAHEELQEAIRQTALAGETYLENVRNAMRDNPSLSMNRGTPAIVNNLQGMLASDYETLQFYDPAIKQSLPVLLENSRTRTLIIEGDPVDTMGGNQNARIPVTIERADGKKYRGMFTKATHLEIEKKMDEVINEAIEDEEEEAGKAELRSIRARIKEYKKKNQFEHLDDGRVFVALIESKTVKRESRAWFDTDGFCKELGIDSTKISHEAMSTFSRSARRMLRNTADMVSLADLKLNEGARIDSRNSAMSAVTDLFGEPKLIAHAENMRFTDGQGKTMEGTIMDFSNGLDLNRDDETFEQVNDTPFAGEDAHKCLKQMANLQVIDYICGNVDRHAGNLMYQVNDQGTIVGIQGIDNDSSFGNFARGKKGLNRLPGTEDMNCISKSMAKKVLQLDPHMLRFTLRGRGLSDQEINFSVRRLTDLQNAIREGNEHYKDRPKIDANTEKPFDKGFIRVVSDEEFKNLTLDKMVVDNQQVNLFSEVRDWIPQRIKNTRERGYVYDPEARNRIKEKKLAEYQTEGQKYSRNSLLSSTNGAAELVENGSFHIDSLTDKRRGGSQEFEEMVQATKRLVALQQEIRKEQEDGYRHLSAVEYEQRRRRIEEAEEEVRLTSQTYLAEKMAEKKVLTLAKLRGKNAYEQARIEHAKRILEHTEKRTPAPEMTEQDILGRDGEALELKVNGELSAEEEARIAKEQLVKLHQEKGLASPEEMKKLGGEEFQRQIREAEERQKDIQVDGPTLR